MFLVIRLITIPPQLSQKPPEGLALAVVHFVKTRVPRLAGVVGPEEQFIPFLCSVFYGTDHFYQIFFLVFCGEDPVLVVLVFLKIIPVPVQHRPVVHGPQTRGKLRVWGGR
jgi:hypothetical protein